MLFDPGLQPERTELAWRRTAIALGAGSLVTMRLLPGVFGEVYWVLPGILGFFASGAIWAAARRRLIAANAALRESGDRTALPDGALAAAVAVFVALGGLAALIVVVVSSPII